MDPLTLLAQVLNFLILVELLRRWLYGPIVRVMDEREQRMERLRQEAEEALAESRRLTEEAVRESERLEQARAGLLARAEAEAAEHRRHLLEIARRDVARRAQEWHEELSRSQEASVRELRPRLAAVLEAACRRALEDLAGADLEDRMALRLAERLGQLPPGPLEVASSRPLGQAAEARLRERGSPVRFATRPGPPGVTARAGGIELSWTLDSFLEGLEVQVRSLLEEEHRLAEPSPG